MQKCLFYSTNAKSAVRNLKSLCAFTRTKCFVPTAAVKPSAIIRGKCILQREKRAKNVRATAKLAAGVNKLVKKLQKITNIFEKRTDFGASKPVFLW